MGVRQRNNVRVSGVDGAPSLVFAHGFGCDQHMWDLVVPAFTGDHRVILFDHVGAGASDLSAYDPDRYGALQGYADDIVEVVEAVSDQEPVVFVGHSVSAMMGVLAAAARPELFSRLVLVGPSARYIDDGDYRGGFSRADVEDMLEAMDSNYLGWSTVMAPVIAGRDHPESGRTLTASFCRADPTIARRFAEVTFTSDNRDDLPRVRTPALVLQCSDDAIAPETAGRYVAEHLPHSTFVQMQATGHTPNLTAPQETIRLIRDYLGS